jgi:hypothetical protein
LYIEAELYKNYRGQLSAFIEFTQQHPTPPREVITNLVITSLFLAPAILIRRGKVNRHISSKGNENGRSICANRFTGGRNAGSVLFSKKSGVLFGVWALVRPIVGRETYAPEAGIGSRELKRSIEFLGIRRRDQFNCAISFLVCARISYCDGLALIQRNAQFHKRAMRVHDNRMSLFAEGRLIVEFPFHMHANLKKQALAASSLF